MQVANLYHWGECTVQLHADMCGWTEQTWVLATIPISVVLYSILIIIIIMQYQAAQAHTQLVDTL